MEWVQGKRITDYADSHNLTIRLRLQLFLRVCKAVHYAHQKGIIHRDIKPSNILVTEEDGEPLPKVIDFGIAKAIGNDGVTGTTFVTRTGQFIGTPAYMSPEQATGDGSKIDKRSDIYSLGVLLYELLTGFGPLQLDALSLYDQLRTIREREPELASEKVASLSETETLRIERTRSTQPKQVIMDLRSGLDAIVKRCLEKKAEDRYDTAATLAADIAKWLAEHSKAVTPADVDSVFVKALDLGLACLLAAMIAGTVFVLFYKATTRHVLVVAPTWPYLLPDPPARRPPQSLYESSAFGRLSALASPNAQGSQQILVLATMLAFPALDYLIGAKAAAVTTVAAAIGSRLASPALVAVRFEKAGISFIPGEEWKKLNDGPFATNRLLCLPVLEGIRTNSGSIIKVLCIETNLSAKAVDIFKQQFDAGTNTIRNSFRFRSFTTASRLVVVRASYNYLGDGILFRRQPSAAVYFVQNKDNKTVIIQHIGFRDNLTDGFETQIRDTLKLN